MEITYSPYYRDKDIAGFVVNGRNVTDRKLSEVNLLDSQLNLNEAVKAGRVGLWTWDLKTNKVHYSTEWKKQIGYKGNEIIDDFTEWEKRVHPDDLKQTIAAVEKSIQDINQDHRVEFRFQHKDGSYRWILAQASFILNKDGHPAKMVGSHIDISEKKKVESELRQAQKMESIGVLAGGIAHDFNNILSSVLGFTELALDAVDKEAPIADDLKEVFTAGLRAKDLVNQILTFARKTDEERKPIQLDSIIKEVLKFIRSSIPTTIDIKQNIESDSFIMGSATQIHRIMMNLCTNAAHAMENNGGTLEITLKDIIIDRATMIGDGYLRFGNYIEIKVSDTGSGIEPEIIDKIFEPYFTTKGVGEGTGMGLAMVHGIVETYGGKIFVESKRGEGTVFKIYLPMAKRINDSQPDNSSPLPNRARTNFICRR
jgi:PAS domain S-box-containing protein